MDRISRFLARNPLPIASYVLNAAMTAGCLVAFLRLRDVAQARWASSGGLPAMQVEAVAAAARDPAVLGRLADLGIAWVSAVFAVGFLFLVLMGARHLVYAAARLVGRF